MDVARPYITGEKNDIFTDLMKQKTDKTKEINNQIKVIDEKIKTEFTKKMAIEEDFNG